MNTSSFDADSCRLESGYLDWADSATKHGVSRYRSGFVIANTALLFQQDPPPGAPDWAVPRLVFLGDDGEGRPLEVMAVPPRVLLVIHAMNLRPRYRSMYEEARRWSGRG